MAAAPELFVALAAGSDEQQAPGESEAMHTEHAGASAPAAVQAPSLPADAAPDRPMALEALAYGAAGEEHHSAYRRAPCPPRAAPALLLTPADAARVTG